MNEFSIPFLSFLYENSLTFSNLPSRITLNIQRSRQREPDSYEPFVLLENAQTAAHSPQTAKLSGEGHGLWRRPVPTRQLCTFGQVP